MILDCSLRDGGYYTQWEFSIPMIKRYLAAMSALEIDVVEIGFRFLGSDGFKGPCAFSTDSFIEGLDVPRNIKLGVMVNCGEISNSEKDIQDNLERLFSDASSSPVHLVRIACHAEEIASAETAVSWLKSSGYRVGLNVMQISSISDTEIEDISGIIKDWPLDVLYFADSTGSLVPKDIKRIVTGFRKSWTGSLGIHAHDSMERALVNTLTAAECGVEWLDGTVLGMGRGPGNCRTESLLMSVRDQELGSEQLTVLAELIEGDFLPLKEQYRWGSNPYYFRSGQCSIHPSYVQSMLSDSRYTSDDVFAVLDNLKEDRGRKFSKPVLEAAGNLYSGTTRGQWRPRDYLTSPEVLIVASGPGVAQHRQGIEEYIRLKRPYVIALNTQQNICEELINIRAACHPVRLLADCARYAEFPQPLATPASMLPERTRRQLDGVEILDYGIAVKGERFECFETYAILPKPLVIAYALAIATSGGASRILLAGLDGYGSNDSRNHEMDWLIDCYQASENSCELLSITPSAYQIRQSSVYALVR